MACASAAVLNLLRTERASTFMALMEICPSREARREVAAGSRNLPRPDANLMTASLPPMICTS